MIFTASFYKTKGKIKLFDHYYLKHNNIFPLILFLFNLKQSFFNFQKQKTLEKIYSWRVNAFHWLIETKDLFNAWFINLHIWPYLILIKRNIFYWTKCNILHPFKFYHIIEFGIWGCWDFDSFNSIQKKLLVAFKSHKN